MLIAIPSLAHAYTFAFNVFNDSSEANNKQEQLNLMDLLFIKLQHFGVLQGRGTLKLLSC
jgi:hypothetical protein